MKEYYELVDNQTISSNKRFIKCICSEWHPIVRNNMRRLTVTCPFFGIIGTGKTNGDLKRSWRKNSELWIKNELLVEEGL